MFVYRSESNSKNSVREDGFSDAQAFFSKIEELFEGGEKGQEEAFRLLSRNEPQVGTQAVLKYLFIYILLNFTVMYS